MNLRAFLEKMEEQKEVVHVTDKVSPKFEASSVLEAFPHGPILFFENVEGYDTKIIGQ